ncbi:uncharacterized protein V6R79_007793 [Siganus canaliculatus]
MLALSATYPESLAQHLTRYMREPTFVRLNPSDMGLKGLKQYYKLVQSHPLPHKVFEEKVQHLLELFSKIPFNQALVFSNLHTRAQHLADILTSKSLPAVCISGGLSQDQRLEAMSKLKQYQCRVLISTDLTSRGIDADKVNLVINLDVPQDWETYMHRIGRAGRFGTQGLAVTYCCHGEEENKMLAIAQKCGLNLSPLPATIEPGLMEEPCDWDVCSDAASTLGQFSKLSSRTEEKKKRAKSVVNQAPEHKRPTQPQRIHPAPREDTHSEENPVKMFSAKDAAPQSPPQVVPTRKELQDALPKIPPLTSFKTRGPKFMSFEEAEQDFHSFITSGLGRSVEVIREFKGQGDDGSEQQSVHRQVVTLHDDGGQNLKLGNRWKSGFSRPMLLSASSNSQCEKDGAGDRAVTNPETDITQQTHVMGKPEPETDQPKACSPSVALICPQKIHATDRKASSLPQRYESEPAASSSRRAGPDQNSRSDLRKIHEKTVKQSGNVSQKNKKSREYKEREMDVGIYEEEEKEGSAEAYWHACYRAWNDYYASMSPFQEQGYYSYYTAHHWMAAYRMSAVYMEELLKH